MVKSSLVYLFLLAFVVSACSDDTTSPITNNPIGTGGESEKDSNFVLVAKDLDSLYWGEELVVAVSGVSASDTFTVFIHSLPATIVHVAHDTPNLARIRVRIPPNASSGQIRVYKKQVVQANGALSLVVLQRDVASIRPDIHNFSPHEGYIGEMLVISGVDLPLRRRDVSVKIGNVSLSIDSVSATRIKARITGDVQTGRVHVRARDIERDLDIFTKLEHGEVFLLERTIRTLEYDASGLLGTRRIIDKSGREEFHNVLPVVKEVFNLRDPFPLQSSEVDSIVFDSTFTSGGTSETIEIRLKLEPESRISGIVRTVTTNSHDTSRHQTVHIEVNHMRWRKPVHGRYILYAYGKDDIQEQLTVLTVAESKLQYQEFLTYDTAHPDAIFWLQLFM